ncbi:MAG: hypothetical protein HY951_01880 [Bacteroidia bacterium]|nr:hypothetical protein [Bacteroidia bacterium]
MALGESEIILIVALLIFCGLAILLAILYITTLQNTLKAVSEENQKMKPNAVWMMFIPGFGMVWQFIVVKAISDSLKAEYIKRNLPEDESNFAYSTGKTSCILNCCAMVPYLGIIAALIGLVFWIIYWSKIVNYKNSLISSIQ